MKLFINFITLFIICLNNEYKAVSVHKRESIKDFLSFSVVGDWGGIPIRPYQVPWGHRVAQSMDRMAGTEDTDFLMLVGDNFYEYGVKNVSDPRFKQTYEDTFNSDLTNLVDMPMYMQSGNHDYRGNMTAELKYTDLQRRWTFPYYWYTIPTPTFVDFSIDILMIDTNALKGDLAQIDEDPSEVTDRRTDHYLWIKDTLSASTADYIIVSGHHPIYSIAEHGPTQELILNLLPMLKEAKVQLYISGHDHQLQCLSEQYGDLNEDGNYSDTMNYVVSGMGTLPNPSRANRNSLDDGVNLNFLYAKTGLQSYGGYTHFIADSSGLKAYMIDAKDESALYTVSMKSRFR